MGVAGDMINDGTEEIISQMDKAKNITITIWGECRGRLLPIPFRRVRANLRDHLNGPYEHT